MCSDELHVNAPSNWFAPPLSEMNNMNDTSSTTSAITDGTAHQSVTGAGQLLRQYREGAGLHIVALSSALKVARAKLEALEADRLDDLPDVVFARALAMSCCRYLGKDAEPVLALAGGTDGMDFIRPCLQQAARWLTPEGALVLEIGHEIDHFERAFPTLTPWWQETSAGDTQVALLRAADLATLS